MSNSPKNIGKVHCGKQVGNELLSYLEESCPGSIFVLTDTNTEEHCLPHLRDTLIPGIDFRVLNIPAGEEHKNIETCTKLWEELSEAGADRHSLLINLGGGVVTDLGGFVACTFKRGIPFVNIPTSLLAMVDASVGGKTGIDLGTLKNQVGVIKEPDLVLIDTAFLNTLPTAHFNSGKAEMLKHGLIASEDYWNKVKNVSIETPELEDLIWESVIIKSNIVAKDPTEKGLRKVLNFGHTLGHAIESYCMEDNHMQPLLHGEAIAIGMIMETYLSHKHHEFPKDKADSVRQSFRSMYPTPAFTKSDMQEISKLMIYDKKNQGGKVMFVLLEDFAIPKFNVTSDNELIMSAFDYYHEG